MRLGRFLNPFKGRSAPAKPAQRYGEVPSVFDTNIKSGKPVPSVFDTNTKSGKEGPSVFDTNVKSNQNVPSVFDTNVKPGKREYQGVFDSPSYQGDYQGVFDSPRPPIHYVSQPRYMDSSFG